MKKQSDTLFLSIMKEEIAHLTVAVKETLAVGVDLQKKSFTVSDLWNIQCRKRSMVQRRFSF